MRKLTVPTAKNLQTGEVKEIWVDPHLYTSVSDWKPVTPERFVALLHEYHTQDRSIDDYGHGVMSTTSYHLDSVTTAVIHYVPKEQGSPVSSPVLMTVTYAHTGKVVCFASLRYGSEAETERQVHA